MKNYLRWIDRNTTGNRCDVTPLFSHHADFNALVDDLAASVAVSPIDLVASIDALGFILGTAIAQKLGVGILPVRKGGKLPVESDRTEFRDYTGQDKQLEIRRDILSQGSRVLIVDECRKTGSISEALMALLLEAKLSNKPIERICAQDSFIPLGSAAYEVLPSCQDIVDKVADMVKQINN